MSHSLPVGLSFAALALLVTAGGCLSNSSSGGATGDDAGGTSSSGAGSSGTGSSGTGSTSSGGGTSSSGGSSGTGSSGSSGSASGAGTPVPITPDQGGYVSPTSNSIGITGAWYAYGDCFGTNGAPPGDCEVKGGHTTAQCSSITFPAPPDAGAGDAGTTTPFTQTTPGTMCLTGTAAKVLGTPPDYTNMFGIGIGLDFNNMGGTKAAWPATTNHVKAFTFHLTGVPTGGIRVEFPTTDTTAMGQDSYAIMAMTDGDYTADLDTTAGDLHKLGLSFSPAPTGQPAFNANDLLSIQFHVATNTTAAINVANLCVSNLTAIVGN